MARTLAETSAGAAAPFLPSGSPGGRPRGNTGE